MNAMTTFIESESESGPGVLACDKELLDSFRAAMLKRKQSRQSESVVVDELFEDNGQFTEVTLLESYELAPGDGHDLGEEVPSSVGGFIPSPELSYALNRVREIRKWMQDSATVEPTEWTLEEFERIERYNRDLVETKRPEKK